MPARQAILTPTVAGWLRPAGVPQVETLIVGGESLAETVVERWAGVCRVVDVYGPTETCMVVVMVKEVGRGGKGRVGSIGRPFETVVALVVDPGVGSEELAGWDRGGGTRNPSGCSRTRWRTHSPRTWCPTPYSP